MANYDTPYTRSFDEHTGKTNISSTTQSGTTDIHQFIDENGNVLQIQKIKKDKFKHYIETEQTRHDCVIGANTPENGDCTYGVALGLGDNTLGLANYK